jgi:hypothetical protein
MGVFDDRVVMKTPIGGVQATVVNVADRGRLAARMVGVAQLG